jgi:Mrp family chromosome partitioning ATPase/capsular polysaccharide biosynthesis protein
LGEARLVELRDYVAVLRRRRLLIIAVTLVAASTGAVVSALQDAEYAASARVLLNQSANISPVGAGVTSTDQARYDATQAQLAHTPAVATLALQSAGQTSISGALGLLSRTSVSSDPSSDLLTFTVTAPSGPQAVRLVNSYATAYTRYQALVATRSTRETLRAVDRNLRSITSEFNRTRRSGGSAALASRLGQLTTQDQNLRTVLALQRAGAIMSQPALQASQAQPSTARNIALGILGGLGIGLAMAFLVEALDTRVRSTAEVEYALGIPLLGRIPRLPRSARRPKGGLNPMDVHGRRFAEALRQVRVGLDLAIGDQPIRTVMITSGRDREGKTTTAANLAASYALAGRSVILVDFDLRSSRLHEVLGVMPTPGVADVLVGSASLQDALVPVSLTRTQDAGTDLTEPARNGHREAAPQLAIPPLRFLPSGSAAASPGDLIENRAVPELLAELGHLADRVIVDAAPLLPVNDATSLSRSVDAAIVVVRARTPRQHDLDEMARYLRLVPCEPLGFLLTGSEGSDLYGSPAYKRARTRHSPELSAMDDRHDTRLVPGAFDRDLA